ncbi:MAG TPA: histidinol dehydrogenase [Nevskiales bacterium]|nr:histidinol dehydrogenase [Nevskiales bacterium]
MIPIQRLSTADPGFEAAFRRLTDYDPQGDAAVESAVRAILAEVRARGDAALLDYTHRFDGLEAGSVASLEVPAARLKTALNEITPAARQALEAAAARLRAYAERQKLESWEFADAQGNRLGQRVTPLDRVGVYVPGGKASYPSSVLMNVIPARVAGVREIVMTVPAPRGELNPLVLAAAAIAGVDRVFTLGGAQAVAALAYGTETLPAVDKIVGPGNAYVAAAKRLVFGTVGIDMVAGPSEILVICDGQTHPDWIAMDLFSQAEHDETAQAILLSPDAAFLDAVSAGMSRLIAELPRADIIRQSLAGRGALIRVRDLDEACALANRLAPEHLELSVAAPQALLPQIRHAGAIFLGRYTPEAFGDYCAGPNHVLPTGRSARFASPLGVYDFQKRTSLIEASPAGAVELAAIAATLAEGEGLAAHARSADYRRHGKP